jgi:hypothetical protein
MLGAGRTTSATPLPESPGTAAIERLLDITAG